MVVMVLRQFTHIARNMLLFPCWHTADVATQRLPAFVQTAVVASTSAMCDADCRRVCL